METPLRYKALVADNEEGIRRIIKRSIQDFCDVEECSTGEEVLERIRGHTPQTLGLDILITDNDMGAGVRGEFVALAAKKVYPNLPIILQTGDAGRDYSKQKLIGIEVIYKPYKTFEFEELVKRKLGCK